MVVVIGVRVTPLARRNVLDVTRRSDWGREMRGEVSDALHHSTTPPLHHSTTPPLWSAASKNTDEPAKTTEQGFNKPVYFRRCLDSFQGQKVTTRL